MLISDDVFTTYVENVVDDSNASPRMELEMCL